MSAVADSFGAGMKSRAPSLILAGAVVLFSISVATAQTPAPPSRATGTVRRAALQEFEDLPADITRPQLLANMKFFSQSLGVRCTHCHVGEEGKPLSTFDFASDAKDKKLLARKMLAMVHRINGQDFGVTDFSKVKVTCFTCHRGAVKPLTAPPADAAVPIAPAAPKPERG